MIILILNKLRILGDFQRRLSEIFTMNFMVRHLQQLCVIYIAEN